MGGGGGGIMSWGDIVSGGLCLGGDYVLPTRKDDQCFFTAKL